MGREKSRLSRKARLRIKGIMVIKRFNRGADSQSKGESLISRLDKASLPAHVAIIMDGNGRWASRRGLPRVAGHRAGAAAVRRTVESAARLGVGYLTLYAFSTENWKRPRLEVEALMRLLKEFIRKELENLQTNNIRFQTIGRTAGLDQTVLDEIRKAEQATALNTGMVLTIALNYGGRAEVIDACRQIAWEVASGRLNPARIDDELIAKRLYTKSMPDPDLLIRTGGELRVSNFLIWQIAYAEICVTERLWPDFEEEDLLGALIAYQSRDRRFGGLKDNREQDELLLNARG
jgi:undecaprenyl diphosphate synthase